MKVVVLVMRLVPLLLLVSLLSFPAPSLGQTYGSGEAGYGGASLQFSGYVLVPTGETCQQFAPNEVHCQIPEGGQGVIQLTATRKPAAAVNIRPVTIPAGWPAFQIASGWGTVSTQYKFTIPSSSAGQQFELLFRAWSAGIIGEVELRFVIEAVAPVTTTPPPTPPAYPPTEPVPVLPKAPRIKVLPQRLDFGTVTVGEASTLYFQIANVGDDILKVNWVGVDIVEDPFRFSLNVPHRVPFSLLPGKASALFLVVFRSAQAGEFKGKILINSNDRQKPTVELPLTAKAIPKPEVTPPPQEPEEPAPPPEEVKRCPERHVGILTQNCQLIPPVTVNLWLVTVTLYGGSPFAKERAPQIAKLVGAEWAKKYQVICLQEVFSYAAKDFCYKNAIAREWLKEPDVDLGKGGWYKLEKDGKHQDQEIGIDGEKVKLLARNPSDKHDVQQIAVLKRGDRYLVTGPDSPGGGKFTMDGGLMILSQYPIIAASGFTFRDQAGLVEEFSNKGVLYARIQLYPEKPDLNCYIHVFNTHLAAGNARGHRSKQLKEIWEFIKKCTEDPQNKGRPDGHPIIICGDFNVIGGTDEYKTLKSTLKMVDAWRKLKADTEDHNSATWVGKQELKEATPWGDKNVLATEKGGYQRLDYILYQIFQPKDKKPPLKLELESVTREPGEKRAERYNKWGGYTVSDHLGVGAQFKIKPAGEE